MFIDLAYVEAELSSINGIRAGQKSRDKKATCPTCAKNVLARNPALEHHMYTAMTPQLYGDDLNGAVGRLYQAPVTSQLVGAYAMSNVSILLHVFGSDGAYTMQNRMMGQIDGTDAETCTKERCDQTFRPYPCACSGGGSWHTLLPQPKQIHVVSKTPAYALAGVMFSPNDAFIANSQQRGTGLTFGNDVHGAVALPHLTGEKWGVVDGDVMLVQRCGSCNYGGNSLFNLYNISRAWQEGDWWFVAAGAGEVGDGDAVGWAALRPAWGGTNFTNGTAAAAHLINGNINLLDTWSPLVIVAADAKSYGGSLENFTEQITTAASLTVDAKRTQVDFTWHGRHYGFTPGK